MKEALTSKPSKYTKMSLNADLYLKSCCAVRLKIVFRQKIEA